MTSKVLESENGTFPPMNLGTSCHDNGVKSAMFLVTCFYAEQVLQ